MFPSVHIDKVKEISFDDNQIICIMRELQGRIQDFKLGWAHLQKLRRAERFYAKKSYSNIYIYMNLIHYNNFNRVQMKIDVDNTQMVIQVQLTCRHVHIDNIIIFPFVHWNRKIVEYSSFPAIFAQHVVVIIYIHKLMLIRILSSDWSISSQVPSKLKEKYDDGRSLTTSVV
jgi:hypothetical protein